MSFTLRFSALAIRDIESVLAYTRERFGNQAEEKYRSLIREALLDISSDPHRAPAKHRPEIHADARTFHISRRGGKARHFFLYRIVDRGFVDVGRFLHDSMDLARHLPPDYE